MASASPTSRALVAHIYISEGRNASLVGRLADAGVQHGAVLVNQFVDAPYHRSGISFASADASSLEQSVMATCQMALAELDFSKHQASHPRLGVVDHIACNPLGDASLDEASDLAKRVANALGDAHVPVYLYGATRQDGRPLAELRRALAYFRGAKTGDWVGLSPAVEEAIERLRPDYGPAKAQPALGIATVGAVPFVHNYNVLVQSPGLDTAALLAACRPIAKAVSSRGGGPAAVEAMALPHDRGVEVACNLLDVSITPAETVLQLISELCAARELQVVEGYFTNKSPAELLKLVAQ